MVAAQEAERQRIARELHDETGQALTAIGLGLRGAATALHQDVERAEHNLRQLEGMAARSLDELRRLIADLRPSHLDDLGLGPALRWYGNEIRERYNLDVQVVVPGGGPSLLPRSITMTLFRIAQEAITNVLKHANASSIFVNVGQEDGDIILEVIDDGVGFDTIALSQESHPSWGLLGIQERASLLGGKFYN